MLYLYTGRMMPYKNAMHFGSFTASVSFNSMFAQLELCSFLNDPLTTYVIAKNERA